jgi:hypothetical protein
VARQKKSAAGVCGASLQITHWEEENGRTLSLKQKADQ